MIGTNVNGIVWAFNDPADFERLGFIPTFLSFNDPRPAAEQFNSAYAHGGGWRPFKGFKLKNTEPEKHILEATLQYPGDPEYRAYAMTVLRDEVIIVFDFAWVMIMQPSGSFEVSRMD